MKKRLLFAGGLLSFALALFKIAMPWLFHWKEAMGSAEAHMWATVTSENMGISLLLLFFAYMSLFQADGLLETSLGNSLVLAIGTVWIFRTIAEVLLFRLGADGAWWRVVLFLALALAYLIPLASSLRRRLTRWQPPASFGSSS
ncbi:MAG: hypothetical protein ACM3QS_14935 [Bacteroidota bacterium]